MSNHNLKIIRSFKELHAINENIFAAIGTFDGVHKGHIEVISQTVCHAREQKGVSMVITFDHHPMSLLQPNNAPSVLTEEKEKIQLLSDLHVDFLLLLPMTKEFLNLTPQDFAKQLMQNTSLHSLYVGDNFTFGRHGIGTPTLLSELGKKYAVNVFQIPLFLCSDEEPVSSSRIRAAIVEGRMEEATEMLGHPYGFSAVVIYGDQRGRLLGFPTVNFLIPKQMACPPDGVYVNRVELDGNLYYGIGNIGNNPTFENQVHRLEIHILDFDQNVYGKEIRIEFLTYLRTELKFDDIEELKKQMKYDMEEAQAYIIKFENK